MTNKLWKIRDFSSLEAKLYIQGKSRYKIKFGVLMSIISLISVSILFIYFFIIYSQKREMNVLFAAENKEFVAYMGLNNKPFF